MTSSADIFIDSNVLIYAFAAESDLHELSIATLQRLRASGARLWVSGQIVAEFVSVTTRVAERTGKPQRQQILDYASAIMSGFDFAAESKEVARLLLEVLKDHSVSGKQVHDANIVATMLAAGVTSLLTHNLTDLERYASLIEIVPLAR